MARQTKVQKLAEEKQIINWLRTFLYLCQLCIISAAALQMPPWLVALTGILALATQYRIQLYANAAVDTALSIPVPKPSMADDDPTPPAGTYGAN